MTKLYNLNNILKDYGYLQDIIKMGFFSLNF